MSWVNIENKCYTFRNWIIITILKTIRFLERSVFEVKYAMTPEQIIVVKLYAYADALATLLQCDYTEWSVLRLIDDALEGVIYDESKLQQVSEILRAPNPLSRFTDALIDAGDILPRKAALYQEAIYILIQSRSKDLPKQPEC